MKKLIFIIIVLVLIIGTTALTLSDTNKTKVENYIKNKLGKEVVVNPEQIKGIESEHVGFIYDGDNKLFMSEERYRENVLEEK